MTRKRIIRDDSAPARRSTTVPAGGDVFDKPPPPEPRLRTYSDEVSELRGALIAMLWNVVGGDTDESCSGFCEESGGNRTHPEWGTPNAACAAVRALGWAEHFDAKAFEQRASR
jgi:hypothetical protein